MNAEWWLCVLKCIFVQIFVYIVAKWHVSMIRANRACDGSKYLCSYKWNKVSEIEMVNKGCYLENLYKRPCVSIECMMQNNTTITSPTMRNLQEGGAERPGQWEHKMVQQLSKTSKPWF